MSNPILPIIPSKRYFTIGEVSELCGVKPHVLRYWEQEFSQLKPIKRRGNRRYYQHHEVLLIRRIRNLLYDQGFTISGARQQLGNNSAKNIATEQKNTQATITAQAGEQEEFKLGEPEAVVWPSLSAVQTKPEVENISLPSLQFDAPTTSNLPPLRVVQGTKPPTNPPLSESLIWKDYDQIRQELIAIQEILNEN